MGTTLKYDFIDISDNPQSFFELIGDDWYEDIVPVWSNYERYVKTYIITENDKIVAGGMVFDKCPPDMLYYEKEAEYWFRKGYKYLGFIWVNEDKRGQGIGSIWLKKLYGKFPSQLYWLTVEEKSLITFYEKNGFRLIGEAKPNKEWILTRNP